MEIIDIIKQITEKINKTGIDKKKIARKYNKEFQLYGRLCRLKKTDKYKEYNKITKKIIHNIKLIIMNHENIYISIMFCFLNEHINYLKQLKKRLELVQTYDVLMIGHETIINRHNDLLSTLQQHLRKPITLNEIQNMIHEGDINNGDK